MAMIQPTQESIREQGQKYGDRARYFNGVTGEWSDTYDMPAAPAPAPAAAAPVAPVAPTPAPAPAMSALAGGAGGAPPPPSGSDGGLANQALSGLVNEQDRGQAGYQQVAGPGMRQGLGQRILPQGSSALSALQGMRAF